ncbi:MAG: EamA family transporter [Pseudomonadota bacterium]
MRTIKPDQTHNRKWILASTGLVLTIFFWSINTVLARGMVFSIRPLALSFYRWVSALVFILPFALPQIKAHWAEIKANLSFLFILSIFSVALYNSILYLGAQYTTATNISLVIATMPGITILLAWLINRERTRWLQITGVIISVSGMITIISKGSLSILLGLKFNPGDLLIILAISSWAIYSVLLRKRQMTIPPIVFLAVLIAMGVVCIFPFYLWEYFVYGGFELTGNRMGLFVFLGIFPSILSYICWNYGVKITGAAIASVFMYLTPVFTSLLAFFFLDEHLYWYHVAGGLFIFIGLFLSSSR